MKREKQQYRVSIVAGCMSFKKLPEKSGVYVFLNRSEKILYVGKAINIRNRMRSHFRDGANAAKIQLLKEVRAIRWELTDSEPEALMHEAELIKKLKPRYNVLLRDDKNYFYVGFTHEAFPKVFVTHQLQKPESRILNLESRKGSPQILASSSRFKILNSKFIGPFTDGNALKRVLKDLRKVFPYCVCRTPHTRECLSATVGRCMGVCCLRKRITTNDLRQTLYDKQRMALKKIYWKNIKAVEAVLRGCRPRLLTSLKKEMREASRGQRFEEAARLRDQVSALKNIFTHRPVVENARRVQERIQALQELQKLLNHPRIPHRIEMYDMSNIHGVFAVGSMAVFMNGTPDKTQYRRFRIKTVQGIDDVAMMREVIGRRLRHTDWPQPDILAVDGGKGQISAAIEALHNTQYLIPHIQSIPILGLAKGKNGLHIAEARGAKHKARNTLPVNRKSFFGVRTVPYSRLSRSLQSLLTHLQDEAHRFAIAYHRKLRHLDAHR